MKIMEKYLTGFLLLLVGLPSVYYLFIPGFYEPHDLHHMADIYEMYRAFSSGQFPPRLGPDFSFSYGYPLFNFYYLLPFYLGAFFYWIIGNLQLSFKLVFIISLIISVYGMYLFLREYFGKWAAFAGASLFLYSPYRALQVYVRGAMGEALALSLLPFVLWQLVRLIKNPGKIKLIISFALFMAFFILSHNYLWAISAPFIVLLVYILGNKRNLKRTFFSVSISFLLSLGLTAYWWLPALIEQKIVSSNTPFPLIDHFPFIKQLLIPSWGYGSSVWGAGDGLSFQIGLVNLVFFVGLVILIFLRKTRKNETLKKLSYWSVFGFLISLFFMNIRSYPLWKIIPFHDFIQFPWRLLFLTTLFTSIMAALCVEYLKVNSKIVSLSIIAGCMFLTLSYFKPSKIVQKTDDDYLSRFFADQVLEEGNLNVSQEYYQYSEDYLLLPKWIEKRPDNIFNNKIESDEVQILSVEKATTVKWLAQVSSEIGGKVSFNSYFFPGWFSEVDGKQTGITPGYPFGQIEIEVPAGKHEVKFYWTETKLRKYSDLLSLISFIVIVSLFLYGKTSKAKKIS